MMSETLSRLPVLAGTSLLSGIGHAALWLLRRFMAAPLTSTGLIVLTLGMAAGASNALYGQQQVHPAPLFFDPAPQARSNLPPAIPTVEVAPEPARQVQAAPVVAAPQPEPVISEPHTAEPAATGDDGKVTNAELSSAQSKLQAMGLFQGDVDGYYGPKTADAIRAFEMRRGMTPKGEMSRPVIEAIIKADASDNASIVTQQVNARAIGTAATNSTDEPVPGSGQQALTALISDQSTKVTPAAVPTPPAEIAEPAPVHTATAETAAAASGVNPLADKDLITKVQTGLASLGFLHGRIDGVAGDTTARAIRNFQVFHNYEMTGRVSPDLLDALVAAGADI